MTLLKFLITISGCLVPLSDSYGCSITTFVASTNFKSIIYIFDETQSISNQLSTRLMRYNQLAINNFKKIGCNQLSINYLALFKDQSIIQSIFQNSVVFNQLSINYA